MNSFNNAMANILAGGDIAPDDEGLSEHQQRFMRDMGLTSEMVCCTGVSDWLQDLIDRGYMEQSRVTAFGDPAFKSTLAGRAYGVRMGGNLDPGDKKLMALIQQAADRQRPSWKPRP